MIFLAYYELYHPSDFLKIYSQLCPSALSEIFRDSKTSTCFSVCFSKAFPRGGFVNMVCYVIWLQLEVNISSSLGY